jgi:hypothetical protein
MTTESRIRKNVDEKNKYEREKEVKKGKIFTKLTHTKKRAMYRRSKIMEHRMGGNFFNRDR